MKCLIAGCGGRIGEAAVWAAQKLGFEVVGFDCNKARENEINKKYSLNRFKISDDLKNSEIFISCLPYFENLKWFAYSLDNNMAWVDLGGHRETSRTIHALAEFSNTPVFTDAGLAPGISQIICEKGLEELGGADEIIIVVGGLPQNHKINPLGYVESWSFDGLYNNLTDKCEVLQDGDIIEKEACEEYSLLNFPKIDVDYEDFLTSGGYNPLFLASLKERGIKNCRYKTLRYRGHLNLIKWLIKELPKEEIAKLIQPKDVYKDIVIVNVILRKGQKIWNENRFWNCSERFSAMQRSTGFSLAASAKLIVNRGRGLMNYSDFNRPEFFEDFYRLMKTDK